MSTDKKSILIMVRRAVIFLGYWAGVLALLVARLICSGIALIGYIFDLIDNELDVASYSLEWWRNSAEGRVDRGGV